MFAESRERSQRLRPSGVLPSKKGGVPVRQRNSRPLNFAARVPDFSVTMTFTHKSNSLG